MRTSDVNVIFEKRLTNGIRGLCSSTTVAKLVRRDNADQAQVSDSCPPTINGRGEAAMEEVTAFSQATVQLSLGLCPSKSNFGWLLMEMDNAVLFFPPCFLGCQEDVARAGAHALARAINKTMTHCSLETLNVWTMRRSGQGELLLWRHKQHGKNTRACQLAPQQSAFSIAICMLT